MKVARSRVALGVTPGRNELCACGSGLKYKKCCGSGRVAAARPARPALAIGPVTEQGRRLEEQLARLRPAVQLPDATPADLPATAERALRQARDLRDANRFAAALAMLEHAVHLEPRNPTPRRELGLALYQHGLALMREGRESDGLVALQRAAELAPERGEIHFDLAVLLENWAENDAAIAAYRRAAATYAHPADAMRASAAVHLMEGRTAEAEALLRQALALAPHAWGIELTLGMLLARTGRFAEAEQALLRAARRSGSAYAYHHLLMIHRATDDDRPLLDEIAERLRAPDLPVEERMLFHFARGKALRELGEDAEAMAAFAAANAIRGSLVPLDRDALRAEVDRTIAAFPPGSLEAGCGIGQTDERPIFILGPPRAGSTLLEQILSSHPLVASGGEITYWVSPCSDLLERCGPAHDLAALSSLAERYRRLLDRVSTTALRITDKEPYNYRCIGYIRLALPRARFVHTRREPIDTCLSIYTTYFHSRHTYFLGNREDMVFWYREYQRLMDHWRRVLPPESFLEVDYEAVVADPEREARRLVAFCGLPWDDACLHPEANRRAIATASLWQARQKIHSGSIGRWRKYTLWLGPLLELAPTEGRAAG
jgi:tetratricopeptide (TPR) repeat protein